MDHSRVAVGLAATRLRTAFAMVVSFEAGLLHNSTFSPPFHLYHSITHDGQAGDASEFFQVVRHYAHAVDQGSGGDPQIVGPNELPLCRESPIDFAVLPGDFV